MFLILRVCFYLILSFSLTPSLNAAAASCDKYAQQIEKLQDQRRIGGKASAMNRWSQQLNQLEDERFRCLNDPDRNPMIQTVSGASQSNKKKTSLNNYKKAPEKSVALSLENIEKPKRKLSECIKPNQRIDKEVNDCMQGLIEPNWK